MFDINQRISAFSALGRFIQNHLNNSSFDEPFFDELSEKLIHAKQRAKAENGWFTIENINHALAALAKILKTELLSEWISDERLTEPTSPKNVAVIMAGNLPLVGFHDFLSVLISGHHLWAKLSSDDKRLLPMLAEVLIRIEPSFKDCIHFVERVEKPDAVIATGSNNSARYFEHYFSKYPHIIRKNRTSVALLTGDEADEELAILGEDIFRYFGLGCRNVSKLYIPLKFDLDRFFAAILPYADVANHHKYGNNYDYHRAIFMLNKIPFLENGFIILKEDKGLHTPVSVLHYERYKSINQLHNDLRAIAEELQCVVGNGYLPFGKTQNPELADYADGVNTLKFLASLN